eukprot:7959215-Pyramimonas_sp.AAC.1
MDEADKGGVGGRFFLCAGFQTPDWRTVAKPLADDDAKVGGRAQAAVRQKVASDINQHVQYYIATTKGPERLGTAGNRVDALGGPCHIATSSSMKVDICMRLFTDGRWALFTGPST